MANEFFHGTVGTSMTQAEFEAVGLHVCNSQATGDLIYASSAAQLTRLGIGGTNAVLTVIGGVPTWQTTLSGLTITLGGTLTLNSQVINAGAVDAQINTTLDQAGLILQSTQDTSIGAAIRLKQVSGSPEAGDYIGEIISMSRTTDLTTAYYGRIILGIEDASNGAQSGNFQIRFMAAGTWNQALTLTSGGELGVDLSGDSGTYANVELFDQYDDALILRQGIQQRNRELLADIGVLTRKDSGSGYMMRVQPMVRLLAGGIYQNRQMLEDTREELLARIETVERKLLEVG